MQDQNFRGHGMKLAGDAAYWNADAGLANIEAFLQTLGRKTANLALGEFSNSYLTKNCCCRLSFGGCPFMSPDSACQ
jgi:hypothetical protein